MVKEEGIQFLNSGDLRRYFPAYPVRIEFCVADEYFFHQPQERSREKSNENIIRYHKVEKDGEMLVEIVVFKIFK